MEESSQLMPSPLTPPRVVSQSRTERGVASECARHGEGGRGHPGRGRIKCGGGNQLCGREGKHFVLREPRMVFEKKTSKEDPNKPPTQTGPVALRIAIALRRGGFHLEVGGEKKRVWSGDKGVDESQRLRSSVAWKGGTCSLPIPILPERRTKTCDITDFVASSAPSLFHSKSSS